MGMNTENQTKIQSLLAEKVALSAKVVELNEMVSSQLVDENELRLCKTQLNIMLMYEHTLLLRINYLVGGLEITPNALRVK